MWLLKITKKTSDNNKICQIPSQTKVQYLAAPG